MTMWDDDGASADFAGPTGADWLDSGDSDCGCCRVSPAPVSTDGILLARKPPEGRGERSAARCERVHARMERVRIVMVPVAVITVLAALTMVAVG
ncbi:hypothetical protein [Streptomyces sp. NBC_00076]|uniref:hypothetical protein n=1 Tax=Streptomyces sp. NBC_00076 TaxID=2975642 RepID=UPI00325217E0